MMPDDVVAKRAPDRGITEPDGNLAAACVLRGVRLVKTAPQVG